MDHVGPRQGREPEVYNERAMLKWLLTLFIALVLLSALRPLLARFGLGRLPGDVRLNLRGREIYLPFTTTVLLSLLLSLIVKVL